MLKPPTTWQIASGLTDYEFALATMKTRAAAIRAGTESELVWLVEHPPLYTAGTSAAAGDLQDANRFPTYQAGRGGQWTYHGPGQRVAYVMLDLNEAHGSLPPRDIRSYVAGLENWVIATLKTFGIKGETRNGRVGIWVVNGNEEQKIGAIGVRVSRWVTWHGLALNVNPDLSHFGGIVPCGIREHGVTSLAALGVAAGMAEVDEALRDHFGEIFG
jgi:lipoyl(octanoyl) transferase